jgi:hypothetical protein
MCLAFHFVSLSRHCERSEAISTPRVRDRHSAGWRLAMTARGFHSGRVGRRPVTKSYDNGPYLPSFFVPDQVITATAAGLARADGAVAVYYSTRNDLDTERALGSGRG